MNKHFLMDEMYVAVFPSLVRLLGSVESAVILQHIHFRAQANDGRAVLTYQQISADTGISFATVRRRVTWLLDNGYLESERASTWDSTYAYTVLPKRLSSRGAQSEHLDRNGGAQSEHL